ncbi:hypothetical protein AVEN_223815-1 [Araneus ventricosus]|uniref:Uncharacterized protein n=1 Tax=Araneus ventricosus TaxID=182803 RepID=A0A4Y2DMP2_ARAVE|nr:hypothetical protein AVEN_223815-1 [Araneus ventricosus]
MGPLPASLKGSISITQIVELVGKWAKPLHFATNCPLTVSFHMTKPSDHLTEHCPVPDPSSPGHLFQSMEKADSDVWWGVNCPPADFLPGSRFRGMTPLSARMPHPHCSAARH